MCHFEICVEWAWYSWLARLVCPKANSSAEMNIGIATLVTKNMTDSIIALAATWENRSAPSFLSRYDYPNCNTEYFFMFFEPVSDGSHS